MVARGGRPAREAREGPTGAGPLRADVLGACREESGRLLQCPTPFKPMINRRMDVQVAYECEASVCGLPSAKERVPT